MQWFSGRSQQPLDIDGVVQLIKSGQVRNIITLAGAGISTAAGIPDFRSSSSGIYENLREFNLPYPMAVFTLDYFKTDPRPFFEVCRRLYRPEAKPTLTHYFIRLLHDKKLLRRHYTQNVDDLERLSGLPEDQLIEAHGTFHSGHCLACKKQYSFEYLRDAIIEKRVPSCSVSTCSGVVKPDVVLFGENLPRRFYNHLTADFSACDLLLIMGTSLQVLPFSSLVHRVGSSVPRIYFNREYTEDDSTGFFAFIMRFMVAGLRRRPLRFDGNSRDIFVQGDSDDSLLELADKLGWKDELLRLKQTTDAKLAASQVPISSAGEA